MRNASNRRPTSAACGACAFRYYCHNVATAVAVVLRVKEAILLTERARDPQQGFLDFPGGFVDLRGNARGRGGPGA